MKLYPQKTLSSFFFFLLFSSFSWLGTSQSLLPSAGKNRYSSENGLLFFFSPLLSPPLATGPFAAKNKAGMENRQTGKDRNVFFPLFFFFFLFSFLFCCVFSLCVAFGWISTVEQGKKTWACKEPPSFLLFSPFVFGGYGTASQGGVSTKIPIHHMGGFFFFPFLPPPPLHLAASAPGRGDYVSVAHDSGNYVISQNEPFFFFFPLSLFYLPNKTQTMSQTRWYRTEGEPDTHWIVLLPSSPPLLAAGCFAARKLAPLMTIVCTQNTHTSNQHNLIFFFFLETKDRKFSGMRCWEQALFSFLSLPLPPSGLIVMKCSTWSRLQGPFWVSKSRFIIAISPLHL